MIYGLVFFSQGFTLFCILHSIYSVHECMNGNSKIKSISMMSKIFFKLEIYILKDVSLCVCVCVCVILFPFLSLVRAQFSVPLQHQEDMAQKNTRRGHQAPNGE